MTKHSNDRTINESIPAGLFKLTLTPAVIRRVMLMLTRLHYEKASNYPKGIPDAMRSIHWNKDPKQSKLRVELGNAYPGNMASGHTDSIYIDLQDLSFNKLVVENYQGVSEDRASKSYTKQAATEVIIRHVMKDYDTTSEFGFMTACYFSAVRDMVMQQTASNGVKSFEVIRQSVPRTFNKSAEQAESMYVSDVHIQLVWSLTWQVVTESHVLKSFGFPDFKATLDTYAMTP